MYVSKRSMDRLIISNVTRKRLVKILITMHRNLPKIIKKKKKYNFHLKKKISNKPNFKYKNRY